MTDLQWISKHAAQSYPLADASTGMSQQNSQLPMSFLLDIKIDLPPTAVSQLATKFYIAQITDNIQGYTLTLGCVIGNTSFPCLSAYGIAKDISMGTELIQRRYILIPKLQVIPQTYRTLFSKITGYVYMGVTSDYRQGTLTFKPEQSYINPICIVSNLGVQSIKVGSQYIFGNVQFVAGPGIKIQTTKSETDQNTSIITISVDKTTAYQGFMTVQQAVQAITQQLGYPIRTINGVTPDATGNIQINGVDCVRFQIPQGTINTIAVSNNCAKPCCQISQYASTIENQIALIKQEHDILRDYFVQQANNINYMQSNLSQIIGSR